MVPFPERPSHAVAEAAFRTLLDEADLDQPDEVVYECDPDEVVFLWHDRKMVVVVELDEGPEIAGADRNGHSGPPV